MNDEIDLVCYYSAMSFVLTPRLKTAVRHEVLAVVNDLFADPDFGLELSARAKRRLRLARKGGGKRFSLAKMRQLYC